MLTPLWKALLPTRSKLPRAWALTDERCGADGISILFRRAPMLPCSSAGSSTLGLLSALGHVCALSNLSGLAALFADLTNTTQRVREEARRFHDLGFRPSLSFSWTRCLKKGARPGTERLLAWRRTCAIPSSRNAELPDLAAVSPDVSEVGHPECRGQAAGSLLPSRRLSFSWHQLVTTP